MGAYLQLLTPGMPLLGAFMYNGDLQDGRLPTSPAPASSPPRRRPTPTAAPAGPEATYAIERIMDELAAELGVDPMELRRSNWIKHEEFPYTTIAGLDLRLAATTRPPPTRPMRAVRLRRAAGRAGASAASRKRPGAARHRHLDLHRDVRPGAVPRARRADVRRRRLGARPPSGCCPPARSRSSPARRRTARATTPRGARSSPTRSACRSRTSRSSHGDTAIVAARAWTPTARARWSSAASPIRKAAEKVVEKAKRIAAHLLEADRGRPRVRRRRRSASRARPRPTQDHPGGGASRRSPRTTCPTAWSRRWTADYVFDPENFSFPHGTHLCAVEVDTETGHDQDPQVRLRRRRRQGRSTR